MTSPIKPAKIIFHSDPMRKAQTLPLKRSARLIEDTGIFLICLYIVTHFFQNLTAIEEISFYGVFLISGLGLIFRKKKFSFAGPLNVPLALFVTWAFIGLFFALNKPNSVHDFYAHLLKYLVFYYLLINYFDSRQKLALLSWVIIIAASCFCLGGMIYFYGVVGYDWSTRFLLFPNHFVTYHEFLLTLAFVLILFRLSADPQLKIKLFLIVCSIAICTAVLLTQTRSAILVILLSLILFSGKLKRLAVLLAFVLIVASMFFPIKERFFNTNDIVRNDRVGTTRIYLQVIKDHPVTGVGFGMQTYDQAFLKKYNKAAAEKTDPTEVPHNVVLSVGVRTGILGMGLYLLIWVAFLRTGRAIVRNGRSSFVQSWSRCILGCFCAFFLMAMFSDASFGRAAVVFYTIMGMMTIVWRLDREESVCAPELS